MPLTVGVEEEFHLVDVSTRHSAPVVGAVVSVVDDDAVVPELKQSVVETNSAVCTDLPELRADLARLRRELVDAAETAGAAPVASGSVPLVGAEATATYPKDRYLEMSDRYSVARQQVVCGVQTQIGVDDRDAAVRMAARAMRWAPVMTALAGSSPYWFGDDTGFASYRTMVWDRWPGAGPHAPFTSAEEYDALLSDLISSGIILDVGMVYFDIRLSAHQPTVEFRVCDANPDLDVVVMLAGLWRAIAATCLDELDDGDAAAAPRIELQRVARRHAAEHGVRDTLLDPFTWKPVRARDAVDCLLRHVGPALDATGDNDYVREQVERVLTSGGCAEEQRASYAESRSFEEVVDQLIAATARVD